MLVPFAAAGAGKLVAAAVLGTTALRFALTGLYQLTATPASKHAAGIVGLVLLRRRALRRARARARGRRGETVLPIGRRGPPADAEAGIRRQL